MSKSLKSSKSLKFINRLCSPALFYLVLSLLGLILIIIQNINSYQSIYHLGNLSFKVPSILFIFILKIIYILFWTWILNFLCKNNYTWFAWFLVFFPFILLVSLLLLSSFSIHILKI